MFTDETRFTRNEINNVHNNLYSAEENTHHSRFQKFLSINAWAGIIGDFLIVLFSCRQDLMASITLNVLKRFTELH